MATNQTRPPHPEVPSPSDGSEPDLKNVPTDYQHSFETQVAVQLLIDPLTGAIVDANDAAARFYGWSRTQLRQMQIQDLDAPAPEEAEEKIEATDFFHRCADGSVRHVAVFSGPVAMNNSGLHHIIIIDLNRLRQRVNRPQQAPYMESLCLLAERNAHDIKNMLQIILASVEIAQMKLGAACPAQSELDEILAAVRRATGTSHHLLASARQQLNALQNVNPSIAAK